MAAELEDAGLEALALLPLTAGERSVGFGGVAFRGPRELADADRALLVAIARQTVQALERARFLAAAHAAQVTAEARRSALERLLTLTPTFHADTVTGTAEAICRSAMDLLGADAASVRAVEDDRLRTLARVPESETEPLAAAAAALPEVRAVVERGQPAFARDDEGAALHLPLGRGDAATAFVTAWWTTARERPTRRSSRLPPRFADQAAIALERAERLEAQRRAEALAAALERLLDPPPGIEEQATLAATAREICTVACETFGCDTAGLWERTAGRLRAAGAPAADGDPAARASRCPLCTLPGHGRHMLATRPWFERRHARRVRLATPHLIRNSGNRSVLLVPFLRGRETVLDLTLGWAARCRSPGPATFALAQRLADRAYAALERARRTEALHEAGRLHARLEASLMPVVSAATPAAEVVLRYRAGEQRLAIGGDFADALGAGRRAHRDHRRRRLRPRARRRRDGRHAARGLARAGAAAGRRWSACRRPCRRCCRPSARRARPSSRSAAPSCGGRARARALLSAGHPHAAPARRARASTSSHPAIFAPPLGVLPLAEGGRSHVALGPQAPASSSTATGSSKAARPRTRRRASAWPASGRSSSADVADRAARAGARARRRPARTRPRPTATSSPTTSPCCCCRRVRRGRSRWSWPRRPIAWPRSARSSSGSRARRASSGR